MLISLTSYHFVLSAICFCGSRT